MSTADYLAGQLRAVVGKNVEVDNVTGVLRPDEREARAAELGRAARRVLVATVPLRRLFSMVTNRSLGPTRSEGKAILWIVTGHEQESWPHAE
jgi:hypothetical protein